jgi:outer membrane protein OmpA-like peptidoglycan-associated protein
MWKQPRYRRVPAAAALSLSSVLLAACSIAPVATHETMVVDARTMAQAEAHGQKRELEEMRDINADASRRAQQLQRQIVTLQAEVVDRGLLLTLDDVLFAGNSARLNADGSERLDQLVSFLGDHPYRNPLIESSAACKASAGYDATLSRSRAATVVSYLIHRGIASARLSAPRDSDSTSFNDDCDAHGLHRNRQVVVVIENVLTSARQP